MAPSPQEDFSNQGVLRISGFSFKVSCDLCSSHFLVMFNCDFESAVIRYFLLMFIPFFVIFVVLLLLLFIEIFIAFVW